MNLRIIVPNEDDELLVSLRNEPKMDRKELGDFFEADDYSILIHELSRFYVYNIYIKQFIRLTPIHRFDCILLKVNDQYMLADLMFFMAIYNENKLKWASGGSDLD